MREIWVDSEGEGGVEVTEVVSVDCTSNGH